MNAPCKLYKYQKFDVYSLTNLKKQQIFFNSPIDFNDPFEFQIKLKPLSGEDYVRIFEKYLRSSKVNNKEKAKKKYLKNGKPNDIFRNEANRAIDKFYENRKSIMLNERGVACFSSLKDDILMWSYYADGHKGFCLEFDTQFDPFEKPYKVEYSQSFVEIDASSVWLGTDEESEREFRKTFNTKYCQWEHEEEWRLLHMNPRQTYIYPSEALTGIYYGAKIDPAHLEILCLILQGQNPRVHFFEGNISEELYKVNFSEFTYTAFSKIPRDTNI